MPNNAFESSRISEGTIHKGGQHVSAVPTGAADMSPNDLIPMDPGPTNFAPTDTAHFDTPALDWQKPELNSSDPNKPRIRRVLGATTLTGDRVRNSAGDDLGKIEEIMLDLSNGKVAYAVLSFGGFLGIGDKLFMVPWNALRVDQAAREFVLDVPKQVLETAPGFDKNNWPDMTDAGYARDVERHYGQPTAGGNLNTDFGGDKSRCD